MFSDTMILVAGAAPGDREIILQAFGDQCHVVAAQTMEDALALHSDSVDLVISEFAVGNFDGGELMRRWKAQRFNTPFLMLVNGQDVRAAVDAMKHGANDCLVKPIDIDRLRSIAQQLIQAGSGSDNGADRDQVAHRRRSAIDIPPDTSLEDLEHAAVEQALVQHHGNRTHAARTLGISVRTLQRKLKAWGMPTSSFHNSSSENNHSSFIVPTHSGAEHEMYSTHVH